MPPPSDTAAAFISGAAEVLPVSSSAHTALLGVAEDDVPLHAGALAAVLLARRHEARAALRRLDARRGGTHLLAGAVPTAVALGLRRRPRGVAAGQLVGAALLVAADRRRGTRSRWAAGPADGLWLGLAQAAALWPGVSRNGATLAVARLRGFAPEEANLLSRELGVPVTLGALLYARRVPSPGAFAATFAGALAALPLARGIDAGGPLWPWAAYRAGLALALLRESRA